MSKKPFGPTYEQVKPGNPGQWKSAFHARMSREEAESTMGGEKPWDILDVPDGVSWEEIRKAYRAAARKWHPDLVQGAVAKAQAEERMKLINAAYEWLRYKYGK